jgi:hypothetical protein
MFNIGEIIEAWAQSYNPTPERKKLAEDRYNICVQCPFYGKSRPVIGDEYCKDCGCPVQKKIFSKEYNACPQKKWDEVDKQISINHKKKSTLI